MSLVMSLRTGFLCLAAAVTLAGCGMFSGGNWQGNDPDAQRRAEDPYHTDPKYMNPENNDERTNPTTGSNGLIGMFFKDDKTAGAGGGGGGAGIGVNSYLWHASLDTLSFMPLASADPFGGTILTDWYSPPATPDERFKVNVFILNRELRADGVRASVFRQKRDPKGNWVDASVDKNTGTDLENSILARARQLRMSTASK